MKLIKYEESIYPKFQEEGYAAQFAIPFAKHFCSGIGFDIGCMKKEWAFPGSIPIDISLKDGWDAYNLPMNNVDYIFSSHCLEHLIDWVSALNYWTYVLKSDGGILFLYLPDYSQKYWRPWNNRKHKHIFTPQILQDYLKKMHYKNIFTSGVDLNNSFMVIAETSMEQYENIIKDKNWGI